jgi:hypothetical protein
LVKLKIFVSLLVLPFIVTAQQKPAYGIAAGLNTFFQQNNKTAIIPYLSDDFTMGVYGKESLDFLLNSLLQYFPCDSVKLLPETATDQLSVRFYPKGKPPADSKVGLDKEGRIRYISQFDKFYGMDRSAIARHRVTVPFDNVNGFIILKVTLNDQSRPLRLLFDTGADGMALSQALADSLGIKATRQQETSVVGGHAQISVSEGNIVHLGTLSVQRQSIALFNSLGDKTDGIIGNSLAKQFIVKVDYDKSELSLYDFGIYEDAKEGFEVPVHLRSNIILPATLNITGSQPVSGDFCFDTGAGYYLIGFRPFVLKHKLLVSGFRPLYASSTVSMGMSTPTFSGIADSFSLAPHSVLQQMPVTLMGGSDANKNWDPGADGSIGVRLISRYNFTINLMERNIRFVPNKSFHYPQDFVLGGYIMGFDHEGVLRIQNPVKPGLKVIHDSTEVKSINGIASALLKDSRQLHKLLELPNNENLSVEIYDKGNAEVISLVK